MEDRNTNRREIITAASALPLSGAVLADARAESIPDLFVKLLREYQRRSAELNGRQRPISFADDAWLAGPLSALGDRTPAEAYGAGQPVDMMDKAGALPARKASAASMLTGSCQFSMRRSKRTRACMQGIQTSTVPDHMLSSGRVVATVM